MSPLQKQRDSYQVTEGGGRVKKSWGEVTARELAAWYAKNGWSGEADEIKRFCRHIARWPMTEKEINEILKARKK